MKAIKTFTNNYLSGSYSDQLGSLNEKISNIKRLLSYYDVFNIAEVVENPQEFAIKLNALTPNSSLVINTDPFEYAGVVYSRGDFVLKDINENISHIEAKTSGVYTPILNADASGNLTVTYKYSGTQPSGKQVYDMDNLPEKGRDTPFSEITYINLPQSDNAQIYGYSGPVKDWNGAVFMNEGKTIYPVFKFYFPSKDNNFCEEVSLEYELTKTSYQGGDSQKDKWELSFIDDDVDETLKNYLYMKVK